jgi:CMP-N,N'-diacetyllegionaminic acid synthase
VLRAGNRMGERKGIYVMPMHKMFQIDEPEDIHLCEAIMRGYGLDRIAGAQAVR